MKNVLELTKRQYQGILKRLLAPESNTRIMKIQTTDGCILGYKAIYSSSEKLAALAFTID
jgi:hypothetical protein